MSTTSRTEKESFHRKQGEEISTRQSRDHDLNLRNIEAIKVATLRVAQESCASCSYFYKKTLCFYGCKLKQKTVAGYNICPHHNKRKEEKGRQGNAQPRP